MITQQTIDTVVLACQEASQAILEIYNQDFEVDTKSDDSPVTAADLAANEILKKHLLKYDENIAFLSEEAHIPEYETRKQWNKYWLIDPLDGTKHFIQKDGQFTVNVALIENGIPVFGVVLLPVSGDYYYGGLGIGAYSVKQGIKSRIYTSDIRTRIKNNLPIRIVASQKNGKNPETLDKIEKIKQIAEVQTANYGSSLKFCMIAEGEADFYPRLAPTSEWDSAAAQAIVVAAGGEVTNTNYEALRYNTKQDLLNPHFYVFGDSTYNWADVLK